MASKAKPPDRTDAEIRPLILKYFYDRNKNATSMKGKQGSAVKISDVKSELKGLHGLSQQEVQRNLTYLLSQGWVEEKQESKQFRGSGGSVQPAVTSYYIITAAGIDKIEGPGEFTMDRFQGIRIEATGQNIITVGNRNRVDASFGDFARGLLELRDAIVASDISETDKLNYVADVETIQSQLAKTAPNRNVVAAAWEALSRAASIEGCASLVARLSPLAGSIGG